MKVVDLFPYAVFKFNSYSGNLQDVDWLAVDVLLKRENIKTEPEQFRNWRIALQGYMDEVSCHKEPSKE